MKTTLQTPFLNLDPFQQWYSIENIAKVKINGESCMALLEKWHPGKYHHAKVCKGSFTTSGANY